MAKNRLYFGSIADPIKNWQKVSLGSDRFEPESFFFYLAVRCHKSEKHLHEQRDLKRDKEALFPIRHLPFDTARFNLEE